MKQIKTGSQKSFESQTWLKDKVQNKQIVAKYQIRKLLVSDPYRVAKK